MCGICGIYSPERRPNQERLLQMRDIMTHRGPDDEGYYIDGPTGLAMRRLSVIDLATGHQPMTTSDGMLTAVQNGEIYNYIELRAEIEADGYKFATKSDTEVILPLYRKYGPEFVKQLNGMFAIAVWDKSKNQLFIGRDPFGIKPLYYSFDGSELLFASEIKAILKYKRICAELNVKGLYDYLTFQYVLGEKTLFKGIDKLLPGHFMVINGSGVPKFTKYWDVEPNYDFGRSEDDFTSGLKELLEDSIRLQLRSDVPLGAHLSGGVDSGSITGLATRQINKPITTFTAGFSEGGIYDDNSFAAKTASRWNSNHMVIHPTADDFAENFTKLIWYLDEPVAAPGIFPQYFVSKLARENVTVVLGGQGSDELLGGYTRYLIFYLEQALKASVTGNDAGLHLKLDELLPNLNQLHKYTPLMSHYFKDNFFGSPDERYFRLIQRNEMISELLTPEIMEEAEGYSPLDSFKEIFNAVDDFEVFNKVLYYEMKAWLPALLQVEDRMSMAWSLESRVPFLDTRIAEHAFSAPTNIKFKGGVTKYLLRKSMSDIVPDDVLWRVDKLGFPVPLKDWFQGELKGYLHDRLLSEKSLGRGIFRKEIIEKIIKQDSEFDRALYGLLCMETWFSVFQDGEGSQFE